MLPYSNAMEFRAEEAPRFCGHESYGYMVHMHLNEIILYGAARRDPSLILLSLFNQISSKINLQTKRPPFVKQLFIMDFLKVEERIEMILIYGEAGRNLDYAVNIYAQRFPDKIRSRTLFHRTVKQFTTNGSVQPKKRVRRQSQVEIVKLMYWQQRPLILMQAHENYLEI
ncbi:unnamed protein product [Brassicogethes aeneus]|uniref:DUF4817 domain-containing protein n=1 Tax=Brassicogethes aeneus TaxID=1431903 RepID=A0A9P0AXA2_BRAAE|nr:unnamed protein product [Brassicogethes aeneus]